MYIAENVYWLEMYFRKYIFMKEMKLMLRGLNISASAMLTHRECMNVITNNLTNIETYGFKRDIHLSRSFDDMLLARLDNSTASPAFIGSLNYGIHSDMALTDFSEGGLIETDKSTDFAIMGNGFFTVLTPQGIRYTKSGNFKRNIDGYLITNEGYYVLGNNDRIYADSNIFNVDRDGNIASGDAADKFRIAYFEYPELLTKVGGNLYASTEMPLTSDSFRIIQGSLESSNVNLADEMIKMIEVSGSYESNQYILKMIDETYKKSVNELGRV